jgi:hypothetical protein
MQRTSGKLVFAFAQGIGKSSRCSRRKSDAKDAGKVVRDARFLGRSRARRNTTKNCETAEHFD